MNSVRITGSGRPSQTNLATRRGLRRIALAISIPCVDTAVLLIRFFRAAPSDPASSKNEYSLDGLSSEVAESCCLGRSIFVRLMIGDGVLDKLSGITLQAEAFSGNAATALAGSRHAKRINASTYIWAISFLKARLPALQSDCQAEL